MIYFIPSSSRSLLRELKRFL